LDDLPMDAEVSGDSKTVRRHNRHGVKVDFAAGPARGAIVRILIEAGRPLAAGAIVRIAGQPGEFISAPDGGVYLTGLKADNLIEVLWSGGRCGFSPKFAGEGDLQPRVGDRLCVRDN
jgi:outer membrane usher protein